MRILVIDDEALLADDIRRDLMDFGHEVNTCSDGAHGALEATEGLYDLVILDIMLPSMDGFAVLKAIRSTRHMPVLMLTAYDSLEDRVRILEEGADDFLAKPFSIVELLARAHALHRRSGADTVMNPRHVVLCDLEVDLIGRRAARDGIPLALTVREFDLLAFLLSRKGEVVSRTTLAKSVWDLTFDCDSNVIEVSVRRLRKKLDDPFSAKLLHTVRGVGYVLEVRGTA